MIWPKPCSKGPHRINPTPGLPMGTKWPEAEPSPCLPFSMLRAAQSGPPERPGPPQRALVMPGAKVSLYARAERAPTQPGIQPGPWGGGVHVGPKCNTVIFIKGRQRYFPGSSVVKTLCAMQGAQVQFLAEELTSHMPCSTAKKI